MNDEIKEMAKKNKANERLEEEVKEADFLETLHTLTKNNYIRTDIRLDSYDSLDHFLEDDISSGGGNKSSILSESVSECIELIGIPPTLDELKIKLPLHKVSNLSL